MSTHSPVGSTDNATPIAVKSSSSEAANSPANQRTSFAEAAERGRSSLAGEFIYFLAHNKKWWLLPILLVIALLGVFAALSGTALAPFIYTLF